MIYVLCVLVSMLIGMLAYLIYEKKKETPAQKMEREKVELIEREVKHYNHVFNYNISKAYGGE